MKSNYWEECLAQIDGTKESLEKALTELIRLSKEDERKILKSQELFFYEEMSKTILNWIGKGESGNINKFYAILDKILLEDEELSHVMFKLNLRERIGVQMIVFSELIATFLSADLAVKDNDAIFNNDKDQKKLRKILVLFYIENRTLNMNDVREILKQRGDYQSTRTLQRDLDKLVEINFLNKRKKNSKTVSYVLSARGYHYKDKIMQTPEARDIRIANVLQEYSGSPTDNSSGYFFQIPKDFRIQAGDILETSFDDRGSTDSSHSMEPGARNTESAGALDRAARYLTFDVSELKRSLTTSPGKKDSPSRLTLNTH